MSKVNFSIGLWLPAQVILLVLYYGNIVPTLPWWVVWFPSLLAIAGLVIFIVIALLILVISVM